jgi:ubiquinone/menaquinone biosynthesis C-methylase UbiE
MKDRFSTDSKGYAAFRPGYPAALVDHVLAQTPGRGRAWDVGAGNGQLTALLAPHFAQLEGTDISASQLAEAIQLPNVRYSQQRAEQTDFPAGTFDLVTVAQAIHWFDFERFYAEAHRVAAVGARIAVIGYPLFSINAPLDAVLHDFYQVRLHRYWDPERRYLDADYQTIPFPFAEIQCPRFASSYEWTIAQLMGYLGTWSAVKNYAQQQGHNPLEAIQADLKTAWGDAERHTVTFPMILRMGRIG